MHDHATYVEWFRGAAPYVNAHRGRTFVVQFGGDVVRSPGFDGLVHDIALLDALGVRLVLVHGIRPQIEERLIALGRESRVVNDLRVTDEATLTVAKEAAGAVRLEIEAALSRGLPRSPMAGARIRVVSGNFVTARPIGVRDGTDFLQTGEVRRVDVEGIRREVEAGSVVLVSPIGFSPSGELFNLAAEDLATRIAIEVRASKLMLLGAAPARADGTAAQLTVSEASRRLAGIGTAGEADADLARNLASAIRACRGGVKRTHLLDWRTDGALPLELFTRDGIGTMVNADPYDETRRATIDDVGGILDLIAPLENDGSLVRRPRRQIETEIERFVVMERDGSVIACAATYPCEDASYVELACLAVHPDYRSEERGASLLTAAEDEARSMGAAHLFVLTTRTAQWFQENGFAPGDIADLPGERRQLYNLQRRSRVLVKPLA